MSAGPTFSEVHYVKSTKDCFDLIFSIKKLRSRSLHILYTKHSSFIDLN